MPQSAPASVYYIYMLRCRDNSLYTGITTNLQRRLQEHCGLRPGGARYTRAHPVRAVGAVWKTDSRSDASRIEYAIKQLSHAQKAALLNEPEQLCGRYLHGFDPVTTCPVLPLEQYLEA